MTARDELPEGWFFTQSQNGLSRAYKDGTRVTRWCGNDRVAIMEAWRIVDAEKEAGNGR